MTDLSVLDRAATAATERKHIDDTDLVAIVHTAIGRGNIEAHKAADELLERAGKHGRNVAQSAAYWKQRATEGRERVDAAVRVANADATLRAMAQEEQKPDGIMFCAADWQSGYDEMGEAAAAYAALAPFVEVGT